MQFSLSGEGTIKAIGLQARACAVGQASAAIFARHAQGNGAGTIGAVLASMQHWQAGNGDQPDWPDLDLVAPAIDYPARHDAMLLPWKAALEALSSVPASR